MNLKRILWASLLLLGLAAPAIADDFDNLAMINVIQTDEDDLTWKLMERTDGGISGSEEVAKAVSSLMESGRYVEAVFETIDKTILIVHRPNTRGIKQAFSGTGVYFKNIQKDIKKKFKEGFSVKYLSEGEEETYIVYDQNASVTKQVFFKKQDPSKLNAEGFYVRPYDYFETNFAQNGKAGPVQQKGDTIGVSLRGLMREIDTYREKGWTLSAVEEFYHTKFIAWYDKSNQADRQKTLILSSKDELEDLINSGATNNLLVTAQWRTWSTAEREEQAVRKAESESSGSGWADALSNFGKAFASGAQMVSQIKGIGNSSSSAATTVGTAAADAAASGTSSAKKKKDEAATAGKGKQANFAAYKNYDRAYDGYETQLIKMRSDKKYNIAEVRDIQKKMREIRAKIKELGWTRAVSDVETWNPGED